MQRSFVKRHGYALIRVLARLTAVLVFRFRCSGRDWFPRAGGALVCANHQSHLDPVLVGLCCDRRLNYLARKSLFRFTLFRWLIEFLDAIPIDREGFSLAGIRETLKRCRRGEMILIFPEGTRTPDGQVAELKPGICALARRSQVPLVPVGIDGAFDSWPRSAPLPRPAVIHVCIGAPLLPDQIRSLDDDQLLAELDRRIRDCHRHARASRGSATV